MPTVSVSTMQAGQQLDATHSLFVCQGPVKIFNIEGNVNSTTGNSYYIQLLSGANPISGTAKPLYSRLCVQSTASSGINGFSFTYNPVGLDTSRMGNPTGTSNLQDNVNTNPVYVFISSTDTVYTAVAANTDVTIDFEQQYTAPPNLQIVGDLTTNVANLTVFADPSTNRLVQFTCTNNNVSTQYLMLFAYSTFATGQLALQQWKVLTGATLTQFFGSEGWQIQQGDASYVNHTGCYLVASSTTQNLTTIANGWTMQAKYI